MFIEKIYYDHLFLSNFDSAKNIIKVSFLGMVWLTVRSDSSRNNFLRMNKIGMALKLNKT